MQIRPQPVDIVMAGTFSAWRLGTLQARAMPIARELQKHGIRCAIVTVPWDMPTEAGVVDSNSGVALHNTAATGSTTPIPAVMQQIRTIRSLQPRAVHVFKPKGFGGFSGRFLAKRFPIVIDSDDWEGDGGWNQAGDYSRLQRRVFDWQERSLIRDARAVSAASHLLVHRANALRDSPPETVAWIPNGLADDWATRLAAGRQHPAGTHPDERTIVLYSRFVEFPADWLPRFLTALAASVATGTSTTVTLVGDAPDPGNGYRNLNIEQMGYVASERLPELLGRADIAVYPYADSLISRSKNSVKLLELMASGCAIIASGVGDIPAVLGANATLLTDSSPEVFAVATARLMQQPEQITEHARSVQERIAALFTISGTAHRVVDLYKRVGVLD